MTYKLSCLNCKRIYKSDDPDPYYCDSCLTVRKRIAKDLDSKFNTVGQVPNSPLTAYDAEVKRIGSRFIKA